MKPSFRRKLESRAYPPDAGLSPECRCSEVPFGSLVGSRRNLTALAAVWRLRPNGGAQKSGIQGKCGYPTVESWLPSSTMWRGGSQCEYPNSWGFAQLPQGFKGLEQFKLLWAAYHLWLLPIGATATIDILFRALPAKWYLLEYSRQGHFIDRGCSSRSFGTGQHWHDLYRRMRRPRGGS